MIRLCFLMLIFMIVTRFLLIGFILLSFYIKKGLSHMDEKSWDLYFQSITNQGYFFRFFLIAVITSMIISCISYFVFTALNISQAFSISIILFILNMLFLYVDMRKNKDVLIHKIERTRMVSE